MKWNLIASIAIAVVFFFAGWQVQGYRMGKQKAELANTHLQENVKQANDVVTRTNTVLREVITKAQAANDTTQKTMDELAAIRTTNAKEMQRISSQTGELNEAINRLGLPKCTFGDDVGGMWKQIGEAANAPRSSLYGAGAKTGN